MTFMERIIAPDTDSGLAVIRLLRHYCAMHDRDHDGTGLSRLVALGRGLRLPPVVSVALASVFQLTEAVLGRRLVAERCCSRCLSGDEHAVLRLLGSRMPAIPGTAMLDIAHGLSGALTWAVLSVRQLSGDIAPLRP